MLLSTFAAAAVASKIWRAFWEAIISRTDVLEVDVDGVRRSNPSSSLCVESRSRLRYGTLDGKVVSPVLLGSRIPLLCVTDRCVQEVR